jgi:hypothetical protein
MKVIIDLYAIISGCKLSNDGSYGSFFNNFLGKGVPQTKFDWLRGSATFFGGSKGSA